MTKTATGLSPIYHSSSKFLRGPLHLNSRSIAFTPNIAQKQPRLRLPVTSSVQRIPVYSLSSFSWTSPQPLILYLTSSWIVWIALELGALRISGLPLPCRQDTFCTNAESPVRPLHSAQDSVLEPLLFIIYLPLLGNIFRHYGIHCHCYAYNTQLFPLSPFLLPPP